MRNKLVLVPAIQYPITNSPGFVESQAETSERTTLRPVLAYDQHRKPIAFALLVPDDGGHEVVDYIATFRGVQAPRFAFGRGTPVSLEEADVDAVHLDVPDIDPLEEKDAYVECVTQMIEHEIACRNGEVGP